MRIPTLISLVCVPLLSVFSLSANEPPPGIVLVIADGTSFELLTAARMYQGGAEHRLFLEKFPNTAIIRTHSALQAVTDSAAAATAISRGYKTGNMMLGQRPDGASGLSLLDLARKAGWSTGMVTDDSVFGATMAAFLVENINRTQYPLIANKIIDQLGADRRADIVLGGGRKLVEAKFADEFPANEARLIRETSAKIEANTGLNYFSDWETFAKSDSGSNAVLGLFSVDTFPYTGQDWQVPRLSQMALEAQRRLQARGRPYLLIVEAALPDKASHANLSKLALLEVLEFDATLAALAKQGGDRLLMVATTDHGTGGFSMGNYIPARLRGDGLLRPDPISGRPNITFATGPGAAPNANTYEKIVVNAAGTKKEVVTRDFSDITYLSPAGVQMNSASHTAGDVWLAAMGPGAENFRGFLDNSQIFSLIAKEILSNPTP